LFVFAALVAHVLLPQFAHPLANAGLSMAAILVIGVVIGGIESGMARLRLVRVPQLLITASLVAAFAVVLVLR
jgi:formate hydrogenlyase subunit 4